MVLSSGGGREPPRRGGPAKGFHGGIQGVFGEPGLPPPDRGPGSGGGTMGLRIEDVMDRDLVVMDRERTVAEATREMVRVHHGFALVTQGGAPWGIVTEWDLLSKVLGSGRDPATVRLGEVATTPLLTCSTETPLAEVIQTMAEKGVRRMLVVDSKGQVQGALTSRAVLHLFRPYLDEITREIAGFASSL